MVIRSFNALSQGRIDLPHLKLIESSVRGDFDVAFGKIISGSTPLIINGFVMVTNGAVGTLASSLQLNVQNGLILHYLSSVSGTLFSVPSGRANETLNNVNARVEGSFLANQVNYVGIDIRRTADNSTVDQVQFIIPDTKQESPQRVPLALTLDYKIIISSQNFAATPTVCPVAIVTTNASNAVVSIADARNSLFRLGAGGGSPNRFYSYPWPQGRKENTSGEVFYGGDKSINSLKAWHDAVMSRIWEIGGGMYWYSPTADRNVRMSRSGTKFSNGEWFEWDGTHLHWRGLKFLFDNSDGWYNEVADQLVNSSGLTNLADGECIYVDIDRTTNRTGGNALTAQKVPLITLGASTTPGARFVIAMRVGTTIFTRDSAFPVGATFNVATDAALGIVQLTYAAGNPSIPKVAPQDANGTISNTATSGNNAGFIGTGIGTGPGGSFTGGSNGNGITAQGNGTGTGVSVSMGAVSSGPGLKINSANTSGPAIAASGVTGSNHVVDHLGFITTGRNYIFYEDWAFAQNISATAPSTNAVWNITITGTGTANTGATQAGCALLLDGTGAAASVATAVTALPFVGQGGNWVLMGTLGIPTTVVGADYYFGILSDGTGNPGILDAAYFKSTNGGNWDCITRLAGTPTTTGSGIAPHTIGSNGYQEFRIEGSSANIKFYIRQSGNAELTLVATHTTNLPAGACYIFAKDAYNSATSRMLHVGPVYLNSKLQINGVFTNTMYL